MTGFGGRTPTHLGPGDGRRLWWGSILVTFKVVGTDSGGAITVMEDLVAPRAATPLHLHAREDESAYVAEGRLLFEVGEERFEATTGSHVHMPRGLPHRFTNLGDAPARMLVSFDPAGIEEMFFRMGRPVEDPARPPGPPGPEEMARMAAIARDFGVTILPPPQG